jgi:lysine biosynthesis protein LysW
MTIQPPVEDIPTTAKCSDCKAKLVISPKNNIGDLVICHACGAEYEVIKIKPLQLEQIQEEK